MKKTIIVAIAAAAFAALATPCFAQNTRATVSSSGNIPAYVTSTPEKCWVEDGNSRWSTCDGGQ